MRTGHMYIFFGERSVQVLCLFFNQILLLSYWSSLYILDINCLSDIWFADIFSHSVSCLFTLLIVSFDAQKFLIWCSLIYFPFGCLCLWCHIQEIMAKSNVVKPFPYVIF